MKKLILILGIFMLFLAVVFAQNSFAADPNELLEEGGENGAETAEALDDVEALTHDRVKDSPQEVEHLEGEGVRQCSDTHWVAAGEEC